jgi:hypothetical protein
MNKNLGTQTRHVSAVAAIVLGYVLVGASECQAVFFDLRGLSPADGFVYNLSHDGVSITIRGRQTLRSGPTSLVLTRPARETTPHWLMEATV